MKLIDSIGNKIFNFFKKKRLAYPSNVIHQIPIEKRYLIKKKRRNGRNL